MKSRKLFSVGFVSMLVVLAGVSGVAFTAIPSADVSAQMQQNGQPAEPNDDRANATPIEVGGEADAPQVLNHTFEDDTVAKEDVDFFKFDASAGQAINVYYQTGDPGSFSADITLYSPSGEVIDNGTFAPDSSSIGGIADETGTYYVRVQNQGELFEDQSYSFSVELADQDPFGPNDDIAGATPVASGEPVDGTAAKGDTDFFAIEADAGETINATVSLRDVEVINPGNVAIDILTAEGERLNEQTGVRAPSNSTFLTGVSARGETVNVNATVEEAGTYYVRVQEAPASTSNDFTDIGGFTNYTLTAETSGAAEPTTPPETPEDTPTETETPQPTTDAPTETPSETPTETPVPSDEREPNDDTENAVPVELGTQVTGHIGSDGDSLDIYAFHLQAGEGVTVNASVLQSPGQAAVRFRFAGDNTSLTSEQFPTLPPFLDEGESIQLRNTSGPAEAGTFYLIVSSSSDSAPATYSFTINTTGDQSTEQPSESDTAYYQVDFVAGEPIENLRGPEGTYTDDQLIRFVHGSTNEPIMRRAPGAFAYAESTLGERIESREIAIENGTATVTFTVADGSEPVELSLASYEKPGPGWSPQTESQQEFVDADTDTFGPGTYTLTVDLPPEATDGTESD